MKLHFSKNICLKSKNQSGCILKCKAVASGGDGSINRLYQCKRCHRTEIVKSSIEGLECPLSISSKHNWIVKNNISFRQNWKTQEICDLEYCNSCGSERRNNYHRPIPYNPHQ